MIGSAAERMLAFRYLRPRREEGLVSLIAGFSFLGVMLGVATLIVVMSVMNGFRSQLMERILGANPHVTVARPDGPVIDDEVIAGRLAGIEGVRLAFPRVEGQVMVSGRGGATGAEVRGLRPADLAQRPQVAGKMVVGGLERFSEPGTLIMGARLARRLGLRVGNTVTLLSPRAGDGTALQAPKRRSFEVIGLFNVGFAEIDGSRIYMRLEAARMLFELPEGAVSDIAMLLDDPNQVPEVRAAVSDLLPFEARLLDWQQVNATFFGALKVERATMFFILTLIIVVAAFNIASSMIMLVRDKGANIAILRTMGATRASVTRTFFLAGASIGLAGTFGGLLLGLGFAANVERLGDWLQSLPAGAAGLPIVRFLARLPAVIDWQEILAIVAVGTVLSLVATAYPAWRASRVDPVEALRYE